MNGGFIFLSSAGGPQGKKNFPTGPFSSSSPGLREAGEPSMPRALQPHFEKAIGEHPDRQQARRGRDDRLELCGQFSCRWLHSGDHQPQLYLYPVHDQDRRKLQKGGSDHHGSRPSGSLAVKADAPWKTFKEFISYAKANPGKVQMGNSGMGANYHISALGIEMVTGVNLPTYLSRAAARPSPLSSGATWMPR